ncbi:Lsr2 family protein [Brevibacterium sp. 50QC2O2]|jgi:hypothetical protein|uniref:histone-like nucleoid-structuring protein Lsr2 n=1 Tax=Brevibacterium TaxID=1696 RepID=UPI00211BD623|nr:MULTISPECIES: Lsr2 family protein [unclassified Brevibacterium]MCQ9368180.1 Lsr2 family protein [Brevibacterium sp. 91QC2O2]MCQ9385519.1 Lsr2 family protein [Brevibacterium sp. 68QC2CO]MCQ9387303.1 Lsr2 family protein [Brevibacterium sp. 50QC2O2]
MAREMKLVLTDDMDGSKAAETVSFSVDQGDYEIELSSENADKLREVLAPYIAAGRRVTRQRQSAGRARNSGVTTYKTGPDTKLVRKWAKENGYDVSDRGRIEASILDAYKAAH